MSPTGDLEVLKKIGMYVIVKNHCWSIPVEVSEVVGPV